MTAPSFSSFPPAFGSFPVLDPGPSSRSQKTAELELPKHSKHRDKRRDEKDRESKRRKGKGHKHDDDKSRRTRLLDDARPSSERVTLHSPTPENRSRLFYQDHKGDPLNVTYGGLHAGDIPKYWHVARGKRVLGLGLRLSILYRGGKGVEVGEPEWHKRTPQLTDSRTRALLASGQTRQLSASTKTLLKYEEVDGFVKVPSRKGKEKDQAYRSITRENEEDSDSESSSESGSEASDYESDTSPMTAREDSLRNLEQKLKVDPESIPDWLHLLELSLNGSEISVSIISRALSAHPNNFRSAFLRLKYVRAGENIWHESKLRAEWEEALRVIDSADVCIEWLDWRMRTPANFSNVLEDAIRAYKMVAKGMSGDNADIARLRVFWRTAIFLKQAGYVERGFAIFQAQAELSFNTPDDVKTFAFEKRVDLLEEFWESEIPRVGETSAKATKETTEEDSLEEAQRIGEYNSGNPYEIWHFRETESDRCLFIPTRTSNMNEDDPYSTILFSDIRPFLINLGTTKGLNMFRLIWLSFMGLHIPGLSSALSSSESLSDDRWADTSLMQPEFLRRLLPTPNARRAITADSFTGVTVGREKVYKTSFDTVRAWTLGTIEPLEGLTVDGEYGMWRRGYVSESNLGDPNAINLILEQLHQKNGGLHWEILGLAFEASKSETQRVLKRSQSLLAANSSSPELLAVHACLERMNHKNDKARKVYRVGLSSLAQSDDPSVVCLWWGSAELEWLLSRSDAALEVVLRAAGQPSEQTSVHILRAKGRLEEVCREGSTPEWRFRLRWIKLRILLELLTGTLDSAVAVMQRLQVNEAEGKFSHESLTVASLLMVYHHTVTLRNRAPPAVLRGLVHKALEVYPSNSIVLGLFLECEKGEGVWGRVRALLSENATVSLQEKSLARRLNEIWIATWEEGRWLGEIERVRAGLEAAVICDRTKGSAILWKVFVKFEIAAGNLKGAKSVLFRALGECPFVKELYLLAFDNDLRPAFNNRELISLSDSMAERRIRLRMSLGELLEAHDEFDEEGQSDESGSEKEDELEYNSRELRRLMPY
ncbi:DUF1740-domain-containing protein [Phellopilus nigrolimitatus]|nr:DUF1740-domain-containing protein [Phellopilus nigrolimitatus]